MRRLAFVLTAAAAIATLLLVLGSRHEGPADVPADSPVRPHHADAPRAPDTPGLRAAARRFARAFLAYEAGGGDHANRTAIRWLAARRLAGELLADHSAQRPRRSAAPPTGPALHIVRLPHRSDLALLTGIAGRPSGPEPFAFLLARPHGHWLAVALAE